ncbi:hypothetical protein H310_02622 [Aphanomyces invadans]|uniref:JmjC domain-containing protein n=1 Tax=Aphanomyces invadans TaxID=157072 RepID=A0A024UJ69_9STRA|nr:hypothetical protein H310_02622 [Aphanomyces invadans]ETW06339.1 hypothetical protein H310_02622 [Aphanomyces invadans]|eukprot:XP_008864414.1 hypothetical protein H310_02622 [Aphanomyces invadans]
MGLPPCSTPPVPPPDAPERNTETNGRVTIPYVREWVSKWAKMAQFNAAVVNGENVSKEWLHEVGFSQPIVVLDRASLGLSVPSIAVDDLVSVVGKDTPVPVMEVNSQCAAGNWSLERWMSYMKTPPVDRTQALTVPSFGHPALSSLITPPHFVNEVGWMETLWAKDRPMPPTQTFCVMATKDSFVDFRTSPGGATLWYSIVCGKQVVYVVRPTSDHLSKYKAWAKDKLATVCFGDVASGCEHIVLTAGSTLLVPPGWIYAIATLDQDAMAFQGHVLDSVDLAKQLACYAVDVDVYGQSQFPQHDDAMWHVACAHLARTGQDDVDLSALVRLLKPSVEATEIAKAHGFTSADSVLHALKSTVPTDSSGSDTSSSSSDSDSSSNDDSSLTSTVSDVDVEFPKFYKNNVRSAKYPLKVLTPLVIPKLQVGRTPLMTPTTSSKGTPKAKRKPRAKAAAEQWYFECSCGEKGSNYDDGKRMVQCEKCATWQHTDCAGIPDDSEPPAGYMCFQCHQIATHGDGTAAPAEWTVNCSCGIVAANYDDGCRMIACDLCNTWQHTLCAGIPNDCDPPDVYMCRNCKSAKKTRAKASPRAVKSPKAIKSPKARPQGRKPARKPPSSSEDDDDADDESPPVVVASSSSKRSSKRSKTTAMSPTSGENVRPVLKTSTVATIPVSKPKKPTSVRERLVKKLKMKPTWGRM